MDREAEPPGRLEVVRCWPDLKAQRWVVDLVGTRWEQNWRKVYTNTIASLPFTPVAPFEMVKEHLRKVGFEAEYRTPTQRV